MVVSGWPAAARRLQQCSSGFNGWLGPVVVWLAAAGRQQLGSWDSGAAVAAARQRDGSGCGSSVDSHVAVWAAAWSPCLTKKHISVSNTAPVSVSDTKTFLPDTETHFCVHRVQHSNLFPCPTQKYPLPPPLKMTRSSIPDTKIHFCVRHGNLFLCQSALLYCT